VAPAGTTPGGLARRVRGANLPTAQPLRMIRRGEPAPTDSGSRPGDAPSYSPDDVYGFLSSFTTGVRRGLDEAGGREHGPGQ